MGAQITWRVHIRAARAPGRQRVLAKVVDALGTGTVLGSLDPYWKDERQHVAVLTTPIGDPDPAAGVLDTLIRAGHLGHAWHTGVPDVLPDGSWSLDLMATADADGRGFTIPGVVFVSVSASGGPARPDATGDGDGDGDGDETIPRSRVEVRAASPSDVRAIAEFQTACWNEAYRDVVPSDYLDRVDAGTREERWRERIETGSRRVAVGHVGGALAGVVSWATSTEPGVPALELKSLYVASAHHGTGLAGALLTHALGDAPAYLWVFEANPRALAFYAKWGFVLDGHRAIDPDTGVGERRLVRT